MAGRWGRTAVDVVLSDCQAGHGAFSNQDLTTAVSMLQCRNPWWFRWLEPWTAVLTSHWVGVSWLLSICVTCKVHLKDVSTCKIVRVATLRETADQTCCLTHSHIRVLDQNGISQAYYRVEIHHSCPDPLIY